jgi:hypothetical protein
VRGANPRRPSNEEHVQPFARELGGKHWKPIQVRPGSARHEIDVATLAAPNALEESISAKRQRLRDTPVEKSDAWVSGRRLATSAEGPAGRAAL